ncbi:peptidyl-tRNA hydrolase [Pelagophyceae sp. CCMP2097]|nr:peptidyl-tRNA hydrolase [Pelagophyceae sp. CCMP2097]
MLLCVNMDLRDDKDKATKMKPGKMAAQCCHAALGAYKRGIKKHANAVHHWAVTGQAKVCLKMPTQGEMLDLRGRLKAAGINYYLVEDAGRTQVAPGSLTVLGVGPAPVKVLDKFTRDLKLY